MAMSYPSLGQQKVYNASWTTGGVTVFHFFMGLRHYERLATRMSGRKEGVRLKSGTRQGSNLQPYDPKSYI
jgi:hypothetical protein